VARAAEFFSDRTAWARRLQTPLRQFLRTETGGAAVLLAAAVAALAWANLDVSSYEELWGTELSLALGDQGLELSLREWVNSGLMTFFFFVVGLEARREFDLGELRERRRLALPMLAAIGGMAAAVAIYLAFNAGGTTALGWGIAMSTDTALALGLLGLAGRRVPDRLRAFILTVVVVDDLLALVVIATAYTEDLELAGLGWAVGFFAAVLGFRAIGVRWGPLYFVLGAAAWVALLTSGVEPVVVGLAMGLLVWAYPAGRSEFEVAGERFRAFREQPTPELERSARQGLSAAISPNERLVHLYHPWTSYVIVPLFAFANAGIAIDAGLLERAAGSPVTLGILFGYLIGKPVGILGVSLLVTRLTRGRLRPPVGWAAVLGAGTVAGVGFTISLLVATLAFDGARLEEAKVGILGAAGGASALTWLVFGATALLPRQRRVAALLGGDEPLVDLADQVDPDRDHIRGPLDAPVTVVSTATSSVRTVAGRNPKSASCCATSPTCATSGGTCPWATCTPTPSSPPRPPRPPPPRGRSGRCTTCCWSIRTRWAPPTSWVTPTSSGSTSSASPTISASTPVPTESPRMSRAPTSAASPAPRPSSSTGAATTAPTTSPPSRPPSAGPAHGPADGVMGGCAWRDHQTHPSTSS
jgi:Na+/H+ antiporter NhaA